MSIGGGRTKFLLDGQIMKHVTVPYTTQLMLRGLPYSTIMWQGKILANLVN